MESINELLFDETTRILNPSRVDPFNYMFDAKSLHKGSTETLSSKDRDFVRKII